MSPQRPAGVGVTDRGGSPDPADGGSIPVHGGPGRVADAVVAEEIRRSGVSCVADVVEPARVEELVEMVDRAVAADVPLTPQTRRSEELGRVLFLPHHEFGSLALLEDDRLMGPCEQVLGSDATLYTMTTSCQPPGGTGRQLHRDNDILIDGHVAAVGILVLLDDFTPESGSTRFFPEHRSERPDRDEFDRRALRLEAPAGSACWFDGRIWHDALDNRTGAWRRSIIIAMVRPWIRQRFDMARMLSRNDLTAVSPGVARRLGFDRLLPGSYEEYHMPPEDRRSELLRRATGASAVDSAGL